MSLPAPDDAQVVSAVLDSIQDALRDRFWFSRGVAPLPDRPESWAYVGAHTSRALAQLRLARGATSARSPRLLECGSGLGVLAALAREMGFAVTGVEIDPSYVEMSRRLFPSVSVVEADLLTFDRFAEYDVIQYYGPFVDDAVQARFERRIEEALRPGGVILANRKVTDDWRAGPFDLLHTDGLTSFVLQKRS